jgi:hypothetical protein
VAYLSSRVGLATCAEIPDGDDDAPLLSAALAAERVAAEWVVWTDDGVDWNDFDLVVLRSTWDYAEEHERFLAWLEGLPWVLNPVPVVRWNADKHYLLDLERGGAPVVPSRFLAPGESFEPPSGRFVVKPAVSAGGRRSAAYDAESAAGAAEHVSRLHAENRTVIVQQYLEAIDQVGETGIVYIGGSYSHGLHKGPLLRPGVAPGTALYLEEKVVPREPSSGELAAAKLALDAVPFAAESLLYARVDLAPGPDGPPLVLEVELAEPSLYLGCKADAATRLAVAIAAALSE